MCQFPMSFQLPYISDPVRKVLHISKSHAKIHKASAASSLFSGSALGKALDLLVKPWSRCGCGLKSRDLWTEMFVLDEIHSEAFDKKNMSMMFISWQALHMSYFPVQRFNSCFYFHCSSSKLSSSFITGPGISPIKSSSRVCRTKKHHGSTIYPAVSLLITCNFNYP